MGLLSRFTKKDEASDSRDSGEFRSRAEEDSFSGGRSKDRKAPAARRAKVVDDPLLPEKKRARRRLIGAVALALAAVIGLPMVLDSEPKSSPDEIQVRIPSKDKLPDLAGAPAAEPRQVHQAVEPADENQEEIIEPASPEPAKSSIAKPALAAAAAAAVGGALVTSAKNEVKTEQKTEPPRTESKPVKTDMANKAGKTDKADKPAAIAEVRTESKADQKAPARSDTHDAKADSAKSDIKSTPKTKSGDKDASDHKSDAGTKADSKADTKSAKSNQDDDGSRAMAILEGKSPNKAADKSPRLIYQVAAFATQEKVDELQAKLKSAGIHSYTQKVATSSGDKIRVRIGPFDSKEEADRARAKLSKLGLSANQIPN